MDTKLYWREINLVRNELNLVFGYRSLPTKDGTIDWSAIADDYYSYILSPLDPEMVQVDPSGKCRNPVLNYLKALPEQEFAAKRVADFGCGPGNLLMHVVDHVQAIVGIDRDKAVLDIASKRAADLGIAFEARLDDIRTLDYGGEFDLIISINSILPENRPDIQKMWGGICRSLKIGGQFVGILPSFDTVLYLRELWRSHYRQSSLSSECVNRIVQSFDTAKKIDFTKLSYADDGRNSQCYHTPDSIWTDFGKVGLKLVSPLQKMYYPWSLTKRFDFGYFPEAKEEIWDWFVVAVRSP